MNTISDNTSRKVKSFSDSVGPSIDKVTDGAQAAAKQGRDMIDVAIQQVRESAADMSDNLMKYSKRNPGKALLLAAASGALLATLIFARASSRD